MRIIVFNGPPGSGKSTAARMMAAWLGIGGVNCITDSFAAPMKHFISTLLAAKYMEMPKDSPLAELNGHSVREFLIDLSESYIKPKYGSDFFGRMLLYRCLRHGDNIPDYVVVDDNGFNEEFEAIADDAVLIRVVRKGCDYRRDSRSYLTIKEPDYVLTNDRTVGFLDEEMRALADKIRRFEV